MPHVGLSPPPRREERVIDTAIRHERGQSGGVGWQCGKRAAAAAAVIPFPSFTAESKQFSTFRGNGVTSRRPTDRPTDDHPDALHSLTAAGGHLSRRTEEKEEEEEDRPRSQFKCIHCATSTPSQHKKRIIGSLVKSALLAVTRTDREHIDIHTRRHAGYAVNANQTGAACCSMIVSAHEYDDDGDEATATHMLI